MEQYRYGLKRAQKRLKRESLRLPCTRSGDPDWRYIEQHIGGLRYSAKPARTRLNMKAFDGVDSRMLDMR